MAAEVAPHSRPQSPRAATQKASETPPAEHGVGVASSSASDTDDPGRTASEATDTALEPSPQLSPQDAVDFLLHPAEIARGRTAAESYLSSCRTEESRRTAEDALETLATVISGGRCDTVEFPWQQVRPYHTAAALTILKEKGAPARIEALRCRKDTTRSYRVVPESYPPAQVQKIKTTLTKVMEECSQLGFVSEDEAAGPDPAGSARKRRSKARKAPARGRLLGDGELRALGAACAACDNAEGSRDAVLFALVNRGLKIAEITALKLDSVRFSNKTGICTIVARANGGGGRGRRVELSNEELILLEDWLDYRGDEDGPLLCTVGRGGRIEGKRLTMALLKEICERRAKQAEVADFVPNDLSRSAEALTEHRKAARKKAAKRRQSAPTNAEILLLEGRQPSSGQAGQAIRFPFLGLSI